MLEHILALVLLGASSPWEAAEPAAHTWTLQLDVGDRSSPGCTSARLDVPVADGGVIYFERGGIQYEGVEAPNGMLVLLTEGERPLSLSDNYRAGGRWTRGEGDDCGGAWHTVP